MVAIQQAQVFADSKHFVDMPLRHNHGVAVDHFSQLHAMNHSTETLSTYIDVHHWEPGSDLVPCTPPDFVASPDNFLPTLHHPQLRDWALKVHALWVTLSRKVVDNVKEQPDNHTLLPLPNIVIIPGDRFRETYYWDSYWIIRGLLVSGMAQSATSLVMNLCSMLDTYGFVPNGARSYYINRSQPPLLSAMVRDVWAATRSEELLQVALPLLIREHAYWTTGNKVVRLLAPDGSEHVLSRYYADWYQPRPESYREDIKLAQGLDPADAAQLYCDIASAAESGWDFSSRWLANAISLRTIRTTRVVPADLNAFLVAMEDNIACFAAQLGDGATAASFARAAGARREAIDACLWDAGAGCWCDATLLRQQAPADGVDNVGGAWAAWERNTLPLASNWVPLACGLCEAGGVRARAAVASLKASGLVQLGGVATSASATGQQWDAPNAWPPLQQLLVEGLRGSGMREGEEMARELALGWVRTCYVAFQRTGQMHEKYNAGVVGGVGAGGEYVPQTGFGWSNGVVLDLLAQYGEACNAMDLEPLA